MNPPSTPGLVARLAGALLRNRRLVRAPIWLYRARLGTVFGHRLLMLEHIGRRTGARRYVVLEVVDRPTEDSYVVAAGFGARAQWLRNVQHNPRVRIYLASHRPAPATATPLPPDQAAAALQRYAERHPRAWRRLKPVFEQTLGAPITETGTSLPLVQLDTDHPTGRTR